jgi:putative transposase
MGRATQPRRVNRYTLEFKLTAVQLSKLRGVQIQDVAQALDIHPFMLSRWRKEAREGRLRGKHRKIVLNARLVGELRELYELKQRYALLKEEHELLKSCSVLFAGKAQVFAFIQAARTGRSLSALCARYGVSRAGYYAWLHQVPGTRSEQDCRLLNHIQAVYAASEGTYGSPRICGVLRQAGVKLGRKRVARLMREAGLRARACGLYHSNPGTHAFFTSVPNRIRKLEISAADQVWLGDITYVKVAGNWRYLALVMDRYSRRILGWCLGLHKDARLTVCALNRALIKRRATEGLIFHSDRGIEYAAFEFRTRLAAAGIVQSMNRPGKPTDNAHMESCFHSLKSDVIHGQQFHSDEQLRATIRRYLAYYNRTRAHSALDYRSPVDFERMRA